MIRPTPTRPLRAVAASALLLLLASPSRADSKELPVERPSAAVRKGLLFVLRAQRPDGSFPSRMCATRSMRRCREEHSVFTTALIVESVMEVAATHPPDPALSTATDQAIAFLLAERDSNRPLWRYWARDDPMYDAVPPDLDDTAVISSILRRSARPVPDNRELLGSQRGPDGTFRTWLDIDEPPDCVVNANVLAYLGRCGEACASACSWVADLARSGWSGCSAYYENRWSFPYAFTRALSQGSECLQEALPLFTSRLERQKSPRRPLEQALALASWVSAGRCSEPVATLRSRLIESQNRDGSWKAEAYFRGPAKSWFGSAELTTAMAIQALARHERRCLLNTPVYADPHTDRIH
jgi:hypothetical protein